MTRGRGDGMRGWDEERTRGWDEEVTRARFVFICLIYHMGG